VTHPNLNPHPAAALLPEHRERPEGDAGSQARSPGVTLVSSKVLLQGQKAVAIEHQGCLYKLQVTKAGKLILTK